MSVAVTMTQPAQAQQRFVEATSDTYHLDAAGPDPELKKILPLVFSSLDAQINAANPDDSDIFAPLFVDKTHGEIRKSVSSEKVMPIAAENLKGISTYFSGGHPGIDYRANVGSPIHAILPGVVNEVSIEHGGYGNFVIIVHHVDGKTIFSLYAHMSKTFVSAGDTIEAGQTIGEVGITGRTTGPHLHFEIHDSKMAINPTKFFSGNLIATVTK